MTSTRPRFFSLHKLLTLSLFLFVFTISIQDVFAQTVNPAPAFNAANPDKLMTCTPAGSRTNRTWNCTTIERNNPNQTIGDAEQTLRKSDGTVTCSSNQVLKNGKCEDKAIEGWCGGNGFNVMGCLSWLADMIVGNIVSLINGVLSWILSIAMYLLDLVIYITVVKFTQNFAELKLDLNPSGTLGGIGSGTGAAMFGSNGSGLIYYIWGMLRDFVNLLLLITIIYYAVHTMFQGFSAHKDKFLYLLVFSIVINFSLFFVKFAIDMSNILSLQAYTLMANPASFEDWKGFRQNASGGAGLIPNATLGDYLLNIASIGGAHKVSIAKDAAEQRINEGMKASWVYQVIVMFMYIGLIYIVFFLAGLLVLRAAAFLFAMLLAALLAADIFFSTFKQGDIEFANTIRGYTDKIRDDFYEALIKGPVLFLFLFLVGVLSNAIFNQSLQTEITSIASSSEEFKVFGDAFSKSLTIFLKFAVFFALTKVLFSKLDAIGPKGKWLGGSSKAIGNFLMRQTVGRGAGALGWAGRNTIGRGIGNYLDGRIARRADRSSEITKGLLELNGKTGILNSLKRSGLRFNQTTNEFWSDRAEKRKAGSLVTGTYDTRGGLARAAQRATGAEKPDENIFGKAGAEGYGAIDERLEKDRKKAEEDRIARTAKNLDGFTDDDLLKTKGELGGQNMSLKDMQSLDTEDARTKMKAQFDKNAKTISYGNVRFSRADYEAIKDGSVISDTIEYYKGKNEDQAKEEAQKRFKKEAAEATRLGYSKRLSDMGIGDNSRAYKSLQEGSEQTSVDAVAKKRSEDVRKTARKIQTLSDAKEQLASSSKEIDELLKLPEIKGDTDLVGKLKGLRDIVDGNSESGIVGLSEQISGRDAQNNISKLETREAIVGVRDQLSELLVEHYSKDTTWKQVKSDKDNVDRDIVPVMTKAESDRILERVKVMKRSEEYKTNNELRAKVAGLEAQAGFITPPGQIDTNNDKRRESEALDAKIKGKSSLIAKYKGYSGEATALQQKMDANFAEPKAEEKK